MRLLNTFTMRLEEYFGSQIPSYSILSHCWSTDEVTFQDINQPNWRSLRGAAKIEGACAVSRGYRQQYIWIDTCCIDKSSSAELSESINSMYRWYEKASWCYVYLEDVEGENLYLSRAEPGTREPVLDEISRSRWFTRGWTLQELIAPKFIFFFNNEWQFLGDKYALKDIISRVTTIPEAILRRTEDITSCSISRKMSWAASRKTTREEDIAYCLLGIFGVNMPLLYGEGGRAFIRLQEEILKESDDQSIFAWGLMNPKADRLGSEDRESSLDIGYQGVLATHPSSFAGSADIVPYPSDPDRQPFSMTNRGLRIELPVLEQGKIPGDDNVVGLLGCHYENDFSGVIGVFLQKTANRSIFTRWIPGLAKYTTEEANQAKVRTIYIKKMRTFGYYASVQKCLIRWESVRAQGYEIIQTLNTVNWSQGTDVFEFYEPSVREGNKVEVTIVLERASTDICFAIDLRVWRLLVPEDDRASYLERSVQIVPKPDNIATEVWLRQLSEERPGSWPLLANGQEPRENYHLLNLSRGFLGRFTCEVAAVAIEEEMLNQKITVLEVYMSEITPHFSNAEELG
ncbi:HET-domain-containing protein [Hyaloscypha variabilis F]|uniref:HET-domain-containing protein n=1 Tax=Hyaloscypha variabilis (strain UAMH 11265 / GT02V1 / F) TaxID=1149755 RepID=A0A2J6RLB9_HYAVF|nr:HET-domain-containing protein [Hyaloscypha variabilis F]